MNRVSLMLACAAMLFAVQPAVASDDVSSEIAEMRELVKGLQQKVDAQEEQLEHQGELLEQAQTAVRSTQGEGTESNLSEFLDAIDAGIVVAGSYWWDFDNPQGDFGGAGVNNGEIGTMPFHPDHNSFTLDQVVLSIGKEATEESRAGFQFDMLFGNAANFLGQGTGALTEFDTIDGRLENIDVDDDFLLGRRFTSADSTSDFYVAQAYVEYMCNCLGPEIKFQFGKRKTDMGAEVYTAGANFNVTVGNVYTFLQPVDHMGLWATMMLGDMAELTLGVMNEGGSGISSPDLNEEKSYEASVKIGNDRANVRTTFIYGEDVTPFGADSYVSFFSQANNHRSGTADVTAWLNPSDNFSAWVNYTYTYIEGSGAFGHGVALAGRVQLLEKLGAALRGEYVKLQAPDDFTIGPAGAGLFFPALFTNDGPVNDAELYSLTGTLDYALTDNLKARGEVRFDWLNDSSSGDGFFENDSGFSDNRTVGGVEVVYSF